jgi:hypothetical protein
MYWHVTSRLVGWHDAESHPPLQVWELGLPRTRLTPGEEFTGFVHDGGRCPGSLCPFRLRWPIGAVGRVVGDRPDRSWFRGRIAAHLTPGMVLSPRSVGTS